MTGLNLEDRVNDEEQLELFEIPKVDVVKELPLRVNSREGTRAKERVSLNDVLEVFNVWVDLFHPNGRKHVLLTAKRHQRIASAVEVYGVRMCVLAVQGCALSDWHMGANPQGKQYTDLSLIFRDHDRVSKFIGLATHGGNAALQGFLEETS
jgi:hypothetical protein